MLLPSETPLCSSRPSCQQSVWYQIGEVVPSMLRDLTAMRK